MRIERLDGHLILICDICSNEYFNGYRNLNDWQLRDEWIRMKKAGDNWKDMCQDCEKVNNNS